MKWIVMFLFLSSCGSGSGYQKSCKQVTECTALPACACAEAPNQCVDTDRDGKCDNGCECASCVTREVCTSGGGSGSGGHDDGGSGGGEGDGGSCGPGGC